MLQARALPPVLALALVLPACAALLSCSRKPPDAYGAPIEGAEVVAVDAVVGRPADFLERRITVAARIESVCAVAGCWCYVQDEGERLYVSLTTFTLPQAAAGRRCRVEGTLVMRDDRLTLVASGLELLDD